MATIQIYSNFADVALAAYAANLDANNASTGNVSRYVVVGMVEDQATSFNDKWAVLGQAEIGDGFSAALFQNRFSGEKALGIRGTDAWGIDYQKSGSGLAKQHTF